MTSLTFVFVCGSFNAPHRPRHVAGYAARYIARLSPASQEA